MLKDIFLNRFSFDFKEQTCYLQSFLGVLQLSCHLVFIRVESSTDILWSPVLGSPAL